MGSALKNLSPGLKIWCTCYHLSHKRVATAAALCSHQNGVMDHFCIGTFYEFFLISTLYWYLFISIGTFFFVAFFGTLGMQKLYIVPCSNLTGVIDWIVFVLVLSFLINNFFGTFFEQRFAEVALCSHQTGVMD